MAVSVSCVETGYSVARQGGQGEVMCVTFRLGAVGQGGLGELRSGEFWSGKARRLRRGPIRQDGLRYG